LFIIAFQMTKSEKVAKDYFEALKSQDFETVYSYLDLEDSEYINKDNFVKIQEDSNNFSNIGDYEVVPSISSKLKLSSLNTNSEDLITIQYNINDLDEPQKLKIHLLKQPEKKFLFFNTWKVDASDYVANHINDIMHCICYMLFNESNMIVLKD
jgi:hypothetical protein